MAKHTLGTLLDEARVSLEADAKARAVREVEDFRLKMRVEAAAIAIFAAMQANPNWLGSRSQQRKAVDMARELIAEIDHALSDSSDA